jgi:hypothetical protein
MTMRLTRRGVFGKHCHQLLPALPASGYEGILWGGSVLGNQSHDTQDGKRTAERDRRIALIEGNDRGPADARKGGMLHLGHPLFLAPADGLGNKRRPVERLDYSSRILLHASPTISAYRRYEALR